MTHNKFTRRTALGAILSALVSPLVARMAQAKDGENLKAEGEELVPLGEAVPFDPEKLLAQIRTASNKPFVPLKSVPKTWSELSYDQYRLISYRVDRALWQATGDPYRMQFFAPGLYFPEPVKINIVDAGHARPVIFKLENFDLRGDLPKLPINENVGFSGFRIETEINHDHTFDEFAIFQGASYFRAVGAHQKYGLSARGLALGTAQPQGEEFPAFREFWVVRQTRKSAPITVYAWLDSPSACGLYQFEIQADTTTAMQVRTHLFPRVQLKSVGIAPLTSMFLFDETNRNRFDDFRPAVHDSDGLLVVNGGGEQLWRPLANSSSLQVSSFVDNNPKGFGLMQRPRKLRDYADLEANYHQRPSLWVEPGEDWGRGAVTLVEIPAAKEIYDNIVAYWSPQAPMEPGQGYQFNYKLNWGKGFGESGKLAYVANTRSGASPFNQTRIFAIDFVGPSILFDALHNIDIILRSSTGELTEAILQPNPETGGIRVGFGLDAGKATSVELRCQLLRDNKAISEVWLYRWTV